jgi:hypothetical protein
VKSERQDSRNEIYVKKRIQESRSDRSKGRERDLCGKLKGREGRNEMCVKERRERAVKG